MSTPPLAVADGANIDIGQAGGIELVIGHDLDLNCASVASSTWKHNERAARRIGHMSFVVGNHTHVPDCEW
jgi:hypothetical protein